MIRTPWGHEGRAPLNEMSAFVGGPSGLHLCARTCQVRTRQKLAVCSPEGDLTSFQNWQEYPCVVDKPPGLWVGCCSCPDWLRHPPISPSLPCPAPGSLQAPPHPPAAAAELCSESPGGSSSHWEKACLTSPSVQHPSLLLAIPEFSHEFPCSRVQNPGSWAPVS